MKKILENFLKNNKEDIEYLSKNYEKVITACAEINKSWSRTLAGSNGLLYYKNFEEPDMHNRFNAEWGCIRGIPSGWHKSSAEEFDNKFKEVIEKDFNIEQFDKISNEMFKKTNELKENIITEAYKINIDSEDLQKIEEFKIGQNPKDFIADLISGSFQSRDSQAMMEGRACPMHLYYEGTAQGARSIIEGLKNFDILLDRIFIKSSIKNNSELNNMDNFNKEILDKTEKLYKNGHYDQAVETGLKLLRID